MPDSIYESLQVPSLENVKMKQIKQFFSYSNAYEFVAISNHFNNLNSLKHLQLQVDHLDGTNFIQTAIMIDTTELDSNLKMYLELLESLLFESPISSPTLSLTHEQVVYELNKDLLEFGSSLGINGSQLEPGIFSEYFTMFTKVPIGDYELGLKWLKQVLFHSVFDKKQILISIANLLKEIKKRKQQPLDLIHSLSNDIFFREDINVSKNNFLKQEAFLKEIQDKLANLDDTSVIDQLEELRSALLVENKLRFYMCADLNKLGEIHSKLDSFWLENFPAECQFNNTKLFTSNKPFSVKLPWTLKKELKSTKSDLVFTPLVKRDYLINLGTSESSYLKLIASLDINSYEHPKYAALLVLIEYFCQTEVDRYL